MIISVTPINISGYKAIALASDAASRELAIKELNSWSIRNNCSPPARDWQLKTVEVAGKTVYRGIAYPATTTVEQGSKIYTDRIAPLLSAADVGKYLAIDVETGKYALASDEIRALDKLEELAPISRSYLMRVGYSALGTVGGAMSRKAGL